jgi:steroid 5-alpha reductase family enzyme
LFHLSDHPVYHYVSPFIAILSPIFITFILLKVSGVPLLEKKHQKEYGNNPEYQQYVKNTALLFPFSLDHKKTN